MIFEIKMMILKNEIPYTEYILMNGYITDNTFISSGQSFGTHSDEHPP